MTVKELKELLNNYDENIEVFASWWCDDSDGAEGYDEIEKNEVPEVIEINKIKVKNINKINIEYKPLNFKPEWLLCSDNDKIISVEKITIMDIRMWVDKK